MVNYSPASIRTAILYYGLMILRVALILVILGVFCVCYGESSTIILGDSQWAVRINPETLSAEAVIDGNHCVILSSGQDNLGPVEGLNRRDNQLSWTFPKSALAVSCKIKLNEIAVDFISGNPGKFTWPVIETSSTVRAYILPYNEGCYVPADDSKWIGFLTGRDPMNTTEDLSMPFWALAIGGNTLTYILPNQFCNELKFEAKNGRLASRLTHEFKSNWHRKEYSVIIRWGGASPVEPAIQYRRWLIEQNQFVPMERKIKEVPRAGRLLGAAHAYLWGDALITIYDVTDWGKFCAKIKTEGEKTTVTPAHHLWQMMNNDARSEIRRSSNVGGKAAADITSLKLPYDYIKRQVADELGNLISRRDFSQSPCWSGIPLKNDAADLLKKDIHSLSQWEVIKLNSALLHSAFPDLVAEPASWGDGVSVKMLKLLADNGFDRLCLTLGDLNSANNRPDVARYAEEMGYLLGPYDSYNSIHAPDAKNSWDTAQFDSKLFETGPVVLANGEKKAGFQKKGYILSAVAARPYVEKRIGGMMKNIPFSSWFIDCDAYGQLYDDFSPLHPGTAEDDMKARLSRMAWLSATFKIPVGSEGGSSYAAGVIHFAHGMLTPCFGWGDSDLSNKESPYYLGGYWPPDGPAIFIKQVPLKPDYQYFHYDPRFRLPLYQTVFHDSVITTHHWGRGSLKFSDQVDTVELLELLYNVPPLYHLNIAELKKHGKRMRTHYRFFSPLHRELALLPLTDFSFVSEDRMVQETVFGNRVKIIANFRATPFEGGKISIPPRSVVAYWLQSGRTRIYTPGQDEVAPLNTR